MDQKTDKLIRQLPSQIFANPQQAQETIYAVKHAEVVLTPSLMHLLYISSACEPFSAEQLYELLVSAREKNKAMGITGMLIYKGGNFLQLLEGESAAVLSLFESIRRDSRHKDITNMMQRKISERVFPEWSMGFRYMDHNESLPIFDTYMSDMLSRAEFREHSRFAYNFINTFNQYNLH